jgi:uncharacterized radical SAM superfamily Fe-S cluster-containing enzyme
MRCIIGKKPYAIIGVEVGHSKNKIIDRIQKFVLTKAEIVSVRNENSFKVAEEYGVKNLYCTADSVFAMKDSLFDKFEVPPEIENSSDKMLFVHVNPTKSQNIVIKDKLIPITDFIDVEDLFNKLKEYNEKLKKGKFGSRKRVLAGLTGNLPKMVHPSRSPKDLDITKILLNVFAKGDYEALGDFSKDAMLISCMHFMDPFNFDEDRVKKCVIHYATPDGRIIPFCTMNSMYRESVEKEFSRPL